eukprot:TRINITY_DN1793_c0_g1_i1.p1 TRINITY_DN1793_c0_g1~~TRINITY_DN1793_c0_g1_i1.p1  ORF type:complete len:551 (-),score=148.98 TRINITY_DN1793_c0_g1_i1:177-1799(-)
MEAHAQVAAPAAAAPAAPVVGAALGKLLEGPPEIPRAQIFFNPARDRMGGGAFGDVFRATIKGIQVAIKVPKKQQWSSPAELQAFREEVAILKTIFHTNVVLFLGACTDPGNVIIVLEHMLCDVERLLHKRDTVPAELKCHLKNGELSLYRKLKIAHDTALGMSWIHDILNMVHRDLKPANLLLDENFRVKVTDFGFTEIYKPHQEKPVQMKGTALYTAPEVWKMEECSKASDVYSFGLILWELYTEEEPFIDYCDIDTFFQDVIEGKLRPKIPDFVPKKSPPTPTYPALRKLMEDCWDTDQQRRPTMPQIRSTLERLIVDCSIESETGRNFWCKYFCTAGEAGSLKESVTFEEFLVALSKEIGAPMQSLTPLRSLLCPPEKPENPQQLVPFVYMAQFDMLQKWFGDFFVPSVGKKLVNEMITLQHQPWFMQDLPKETADWWLSNRDDGTFLIRLSVSTPSTFPVTISKRRGNQNVHRRVQRLTLDPDAQERYSVETNHEAAVIRSHSVPELVQRLLDIHSVKAACPRECYGSIYVGTAH